MKKTLLIFIAIACTVHVTAQDINAEGDIIQHQNTSTVVKHETKYSGWGIDINTMGGWLTQKYTVAAPSVSYKNPMDAKISTMQFSKGATYGMELQGSYFFGEDQHWGAGMGLMYLYQHGYAAIDKFSIQYQSTDKFGNTFRQVITADQPVKENLDMYNISIPVLAKYRTKFTRSIGFSADAGFLVNLQQSNSYNTSASFDYEAIYKYQGTQGNLSTVYDNAILPGPADLVITKGRYLTDHSAAGINDYFNSVAAQGYNVGLNVKPNNTTGKVAYKKYSVGLLFRPTVSFYLDDHLILNAGAYYMMQNFTHDVAANSKLTDKVGDYNSMLSSVTKTATNSYGISIGLRYSFGKVEERVHDAPVMTENSVERGKKARDDDDDDEDEKKSVIDIEKKSYEYDAPKRIDIATPILFDENKMVIKPNADPVLDQAVKELSEHKKSTLVIHGYSDNKGKPAANKALSQKRAGAVKSYLQKKGVNPNKMKTVGHGAASPAASNKTAAGRAKNRRVILKLQENKKQTLQKR